jgi:hypothetical protein
MPATPRHLMTVDEFHAWVPPLERDRWELIDGKPHRLLRHPKPTDFAARTPEELIRLLDAAEACDLAQQPPLPTD